MLSNSPASPSKEPSLPSAAVTADAMAGLGTLREWYSTFFGNNKTFYTDVVTKLANQSMMAGNHFKQQLCQEWQITHDEQKTLIHVLVDLSLFRIRTNTRKALEAYIVNEDEGAYEKLREALTNNANDAAHLISIASNYNKFFIQQLQEKEQQLKKSLTLLWQQKNCTQAIQENIALLKEARLSDYLRFDSLLKMLRPLETSIGNTNDLTTFITAVEVLKKAGVTYSFFSLEELQHFQSNFASQLIDHNELTKLCNAIITVCDHLPCWARFTQLTNLLNDSSYKALFKKVVTSIQNFNSTKMSQSEHLQALSSLVDKFFDDMQKHEDLLDMDTFLDYVNDKEPKRFTQRFYELAHQTTAEDMADMIATLSEFKPHIDIYLNLKTPKKLDIIESKSEASPLRSARSPASCLITLFPSPRKNQPTPPSPPSTAQRRLSALFNTVATTINLDNTISEEEISTESKATPPSNGAETSSRDTTLKATTTNLDDTISEEEIWDIPTTENKSTPPSSGAKTSSNEAAPNICFLIKRALEDVAHWPKQVNYYNRFWRLPGTAMMINNTKYIYPDLAAKLKKIIDTPLPDNEIIASLTTLLPQLAKSSRYKYKILVRENTTDHFYHAIAYLLEHHQNFEQLYLVNDANIMNAIKTVDSKGETPFSVEENQESRPILNGKHS